MTKTGATGATAGALVPPLDLVIMPLLEKSGQLGAPGDLIIAIDDKRVESEIDLQDAEEDVADAKDDETRRRALEKGRTLTRRPDGDGK